MSDEPGLRPDPRDLYMTALASAVRAAREQNATPAEWVALLEELRLAVERDRMTDTAKD